MFSLAIKALHRFNLIVNTTETHRKNIKAKLKVSSTFELNQYASAFDMI
jgi:DNA-binding CsgD family transcriptional regulator